MNTNQFNEEVRFNRFANAVQGNFAQGTIQSCSACTKFYQKDAVFFQCANDISNRHRIHSRGQRQQFTGDFLALSILADKDKAMDRSGSFGADMHDLPLPAPILFLNRVD